MSDRIHIEPMGDLKPHNTMSAHCACKPRIEGNLVIHNAWDGREFYEQGGESNAATTEPERSPEN